MIFNWKYFLDSNPRRRFQVFMMELHAIISSGKINMKTKITISCITALFLTGCMATSQDIAVDNYSGHTVRGFTIRTESKSFDFTFGQLNPDDHTPVGQRGYAGPMRIAPHDKCEVLWVDEAGKTQSVKIDLKTEAKLKSNANILFKLTTNNVIQVSMLPQHP